MMHSREEAALARGWLPRTRTQTTRSRENGNVNAELSPQHLVVCKPRARNKSSQTDCPNLGHLEG